MTLEETYQQQFDSFTLDVAQHTVTVLRDDGLYRHLRCSDGTFCMQFDVVTWPGYLAYVGDVGAYVFSRLSDMFEFFRGRRTPIVDRSYLAEKAVATDKTDGIYEYSEAMFLAAVKSDYDAFVESRELDADEASDLWEAIDDDVLCASDNEHDAVSAATSFRWSHGRATHNGREVFPYFWEHRLKDYTVRFSWCCYAIPWAIDQYDRLKLEAATSVDARLTRVEEGTPTGSAREGL